MGFIVNKNIHKYVIECTSILKRIAFIKLRITKFCLVKIIQVYALTTSYEDKEVETFDKEITRATHQESSQYTIIMREFNTRLRSRKEADEDKIGRFGLDETNERVQMLMNFLEQQEVAMNIFYKKTQVENGLGSQQINNTKQNWQLTGYISGQLCSNGDWPSYCTGCAENRHEMGKNENNETYHLQLRRNSERKEIAIILNNLKEISIWLRNTLKRQSMNEKNN